MAAIRPGASADIEPLVKKLRDGDERERREAVKGLVELGTEEAWSLVLECLGDSSGQVADQAQLDLVRMPAEMRSELLGRSGLKSRRGLVSLRVAEALGRMNSAQSEQDYILALRLKDAAVLRSLLWSLERLAREGLLGMQNQDLVKGVVTLASKHKSEEVRAHALLALAELDSSATLPLLTEFSRSKKVPMRAAAAELIDRFPAQDREAAIEAAISDEAFVVRLRAYESLAAIGDRASLMSLIDALEEEPRLRCSWRLVGLLRESSGMKYGLDPRPWRLWLSGLPEGWTSDRKHEAEEPGTEGTVSFVGMRVISDRVAFLVDFSGSMWKERDGKTRKERVDDEMRRVLSGLDEEVRFNIHPFASEPLRWQKKLTVATARNVRAAIDFFEACNTRGSGDFWKAAMDCLNDPDVDTLIVLGDGAPSGGERWNMDLMKDLFLHENRFRGLMLDVLLIDCSPWLSSRWEFMSERTGGRCIGVKI